MPDAVNDSSMAVGTEAVSGFPKVHPMEDRVMIRQNDDFRFMEVRFD